MSENEQEVMLSEYTVCNDKAHSYMTVCWQIGGILITASILMLGISIQVFPNPLGILLIVISLITVYSWFRIYLRFNWICKRAFDRAKALEEYFIQNHEQLRNLEYRGNSTTMINSWITNLDQAEISIPRTVVHLRRFLCALVSIYLLVLIIYLSYHALKILIWAHSFF